MTHLPTASYGFLYGILSSVHATRPKTRFITLFNAFLDNYARVLFERARVANKTNRKHKLTRNL